MHDLAIAGSGPAGLSASVYASRYGIKNIVFGEVSGGLVSETHEIGNWLGTEKISGFDFSQKAKAHAESLGAEIVAKNIEKIERDGGVFKITAGDSAVLVKAVILATGTRHRHLNIPGEKEFRGRGVSYCATCDGFFFRNKKVVVIGGGNSACGAAAYLSDIAEKVFLVYRKEKLRAEDFWIKALRGNPKVEIVYSSNVLEIKGADKVSGVVLDNNYKDSKEVQADGVFVEIGLEPNISLAKQLGVDLDENEFVRVDNSMKTSVSGVWAAGDITTGSNKFRQIITAASEGAIAVESVNQYLKRLI